jgi:YD repeat-containing protein
MTTTFPVISTAQNGSGAANVQLMLFDQFGNMTWEQGPRGFIDNFTYDVPTGGQVQMIEDVDPSLLALPTGWTRPGGLLPPLNLVTDFEIDDLARTTQVLGPLHPVNGVNVRTATWTAYLDEQHQAWSAQGFATGTPSYYRYTLVNPVTLASFDYAGRPTQVIQAVRATTDGPLSRSDCYSQSSWVRWSDNIYNNAGQLTTTRAYSTIPARGIGAPGDNYDETDYGYDVMDRQIMHTTPGGTITRTTYDPRGLVTGVYVGTNDAGASASDPTNGGTGGNNLVQVTGQVYDGGSSGGDGNLTQRTDFVDATGTNDRVTSYGYDWRNRRVSVDGELDYFVERSYDNLGRAVQSDRLNGTENGQLLARTLTFYDDLSRVYQTQRFSVDPSNGALGNALIDNKWYDQAGNLIKSLPAGSQLFTKTMYDSQVRIYAVYQGAITRGPRPNLTFRSG